MSELEHSQNATLEIAEDALEEILEMTDGRKDRLPAAVASIAGIAARALGRIGKFRKASEMRLNGMEDDIEY